MIYELKAFPLLFHAIFMGHRTSILKGEGNFGVGDTIIFKEYDYAKEKYTGKSLARSIKNVQPSDRADLGLVRLTFA